MNLPNNGFVGVGGRKHSKPALKTIQPLFTDGNGIKMQWTGSAGTDY